MEQQNVVNLPRKPKVSLVVGGIVLLFLVGMGMYILGKNSSSSKINIVNSPTPIPTHQFNTPSVTASPSKDTNNPNLMTVNMSFSGSEQWRPYWSFQTKYPSMYLVTSDEMMTSYKSQGGQAPPRLLFTVGQQPLNRNHYDVYTSGEKCLAIWTTSGFKSLKDWRNNVAIGEHTSLSSTKQKFNTYEFQLEEVQTKDNKIHRVEALINFPEDTSYYFHTCDMSNREDLMTILRNFDIRGKNSI